MKYPVFLEPGNDDGLLLNANAVKGTYVVVETVNDMNDLLINHSGSIVDGSLCYVVAEDKTYRYENNNWERSQIELDIAELKGKVSGDQTDISALQDKINKNVLNNLSISTNQDQVNINTTTINILNNEIASDTDTLPLATTENAGLMALEDYSTLYDLQVRVENLEGTTNRFLYNTQDTLKSVTLNEVVYSPAFYINGELFQVVNNNTIEQILQSNLRNFTGVFKDELQLTTKIFNVNFISNGITYDKIQITSTSILYGETIVFNGTWTAIQYKTLRFIDGNDIANTDLIDFLKTNCGLLSSSFNIVTTTYDYVTTIKCTINNIEYKFQALTVGSKITREVNANNVNAFVTTLYDKRGQQLYFPPFKGISVVVNETYHIWHYYPNEEDGVVIGWKDDGLDTVEQFTNNTAGIIRGSANDGQVYAESNGTGSVVGWSSLKNRVTDLENNKADDVLANDEHKGLMTASDFTKLQTVESGAQVNILEKVKANGVDITPNANKEINIKAGTDILFQLENNELTINATIPDPVTIDSELSSSSINPVQNKVITEALNEKADLDIVQLKIDSENKLGSDLVDTENQTNKFVTQAEKQQITTNKNDITALTNSKQNNVYAGRNMYWGNNNVLNTYAARVTPNITQNTQNTLSTIKIEDTLYNIPVYGLTIISMGYSITTHLSNVMGSPFNPTGIESESSATLSFSAVSGYVLPDYITVTNADYTWNDGVLVLANPTSDVSITIIATSQSVEPETRNPGLYQNNIMVKSWNDIIQDYPDSFTNNYTKMISSLELDKANRNGDFAGDLVISPNITEIGEDVFERNQSLLTVTIPSSVVKLGKSAFEDCTNLIDVNLGEGVQIIDENCFNDCTNLFNITIGGSLREAKSKSFEGCFNLKEIHYNGVLEQLLNINFESTPMNFVEHFYMLQNNQYTEITEITIPNSMNTIRDELFMSWSFLRRITMHNNITNIGKYAFWGCINLTTIKMSTSIQTIEIGAFIGCSNLLTLEIPDTIRYIGKYAFDNCESLQYNTYDNGLYLGNTTHPYLVLIGPVNSNISSCTINQNTKIIMNKIFNNLQYLDSINIPQNVVYIGGNSFKDVSYITVDSNNTTYDSRNNCNAIIKTSINELVVGCKNTIIPNNIQTIGEDAFYEVELNIINMPNNIIEIKTRAFYSTPISNITLSDNLKIIGSYAFYNCTNLTQLIIPQSMETIELNAFENCYRLVEIYNLSNLNIQIGSTDNGQVGYYAKVIHTSLNEPSVMEWSNDVLYYNDGIDKIAIQVLNSNVTNITIDNDCTAINEEAFINCRTLENVNIPDTVESIGDRVFYNCFALDTITFGQNSQLLTIGDYAFNSCRSLTTITIPDTVTSIGRWAFSSCINLTSIDLPSNLTIINSDIFEYCTNLTNITIPSNVESIGNSAFEGCTNLTSIIFESGNNQINYISDNAFRDCNNLQYNTYSNGKYLGSSLNPYLVFISSINKEINDCNIHEDTILIADRAFYHCDNLEEIEIPNNIQYINNYAFYACENLRIVKLKNTSTLFIGYDAFFTGSDNLKYVYYDGTIENWCNIEFERQTSTPMFRAEHFYILNNGSYNELTNLVIPNTISEIKPYTFYNFNKITNLIIPSSVESIGDYAFEKCENLTNINIENGLLNIGSYAFSQCNNLINITLPGSITNIGNDNFSTSSNLENMYYNGTINNWCNIVFESRGSNPMSINGLSSAHLKFYIKNSSLQYEELTEIEIPNDVVEIKNYTFYGFKDVINITFLGNIENIGQYGFASCSACNYFDFSENTEIPQIDSTSFNYIYRNYKIIVPDNLYENWIIAENWENIASHIIKNSDWVNE